jgi:hypothetical protein
MTEEKKNQKQVNQKQYIWLVLGIAAILLFWLLSSWVYK